MKCLGRYILLLFWGLLPAYLTAQVADSFVLVPGGAYIMGDQFGEGSQDELPLHQVKVRSFYLSPCELTTGEYLRFVETTHANYPAWLDQNSPYHYRTGAKDYYRALDSILFDSQRPIVGITWKNAVAYCNWLSTEHGLSPAYQMNSDTIVWTPGANGYRLPTEAEWEYAAREGGKKVRFGTGRDSVGSRDINVDARAAFARAYVVDSFHRDYTLPVRTLQPNALGLYHMSGNVWEWCQDWYAADYYGQANQPASPRGPTAGTQKVLRGGSWYFDGYHARCSNRHHARPGQHFHAAGVRLARNRA
ncbi:MAG TPA: SUMF1/EgtB/PvdO family nonheme iron enzyme [Saprospiraceae bacterium]|nr:SUMF1/EgtB/PvdO family nonheme iron enzyme [Saprospiraceae bacterium]HPI08956.1 SUMF1/EgtB/PvdO family nonheme iron enzyme [Saprospiraceae bacterium]